MSAENQKTDEQNSSLLSLIRQRGCSTLTNLAYAMEKSPNALSANPSLFSEQKNHDPEFAKQLSEFVNNPTGQVTIPLVISELSPIIERSGSNLIKKIDEMFHKQDISNLSNRNDLYTIIDYLCTGDSVVTIATNISEEFSDNVMREKIANAILRGVRFKYVYPDNETFKELVRFSLSPLLVNDRHKELQDAVWTAMLKAQPEISNQTDPTDNSCLMDIIMPSFFIADRSYINIAHNYKAISTKKSGNEYHEHCALESSLIGSPICHKGISYWAWNPIPVFLSKKLLSYTKELTANVDTSSIQISQKTRDFLETIGITIESNS